MISIYFDVVVVVLWEGQGCSVAVWSSVADMSSHLVTNNERSSFHQ